MTVSNETYKKIGFFTALSMLIGSVIGVGIFLKNGGIFATNNGNAIGVLIAWILGAIIAFTTAYSFAEIGSSISSHSGIAGWSEKMVGKRFGNFVKIVFPLFYISILEVALSIFAAETIFRLFDQNSEIHLGVVMFVGLILMLFFMTFNFISLKLSGSFSFITTILKFVPILAIIISGVAFAAINHTTGMFSESNGKSSNPEFTLILASLPSVLFAFDSFTNIGNLALDIKKPEKNVSLIIIVGMLFCSIIYILITVSQILASEGDGTNFFNKSFFGNQNVREGLTIFVNVFMMISIFGVVNSFSASIIRSFNSIVEEKVFFGYRIIENISYKVNFGSKELKSGFILSTFTTLFWWIVLLIPSVSIGENGTDAFVDGVSNFPTLFFFLVYGILVMSGIINRITKKVEVKKYKMFLFLAPISFVGITLVFCYIFFYQYLVSPFINGNNLSWGLFYSGGYITKSYVGTIWFFVSLFLFLSIPLVNNLLLKLVNKNKTVKKNEQ